MKSYFPQMIGVALFFLVAAAGYQANAQSISVDKMTVPVVTIQERELIDFFMFEFFIAETLVTKMEIIDATGNGFGEGDLVKTYPSEEIYFPVPSDSAQKIMNSWQFTANFQIVTESQDPDEFENLPTQQAENGIFASILKGVNRNYRDAPINIWFQRDARGSTFEMWGFNKDSLQYTPPPPPVPDSVVTYDLVHVFHTDTLIKADSTIYDMIYVYKTVSDTLIFGDQVQIYQTAKQE